MTDHQPADNVGGRCDYPALELGRREAARPAVEQLHRLRTGFDLARQIIDGDGDDPVDQRLESSGIAIRQPPRLTLILAAAAGDHIGGDSPRRSGKADQRRRRRQCGTNPTNRLVDRREPLELRDQPVQPPVGERRDEPRPFADAEAQIHAHRVRHDQDVREEDRGVEAEALDRLQRDLGRGFAVVNQFEKAALRRPQRTIFGKIASRLSHQPNRRWIHAFATENGEQGRCSLGSEHGGTESRSTGLRQPLPAGHRPTSESLESLKSDEGCSAVDCRGSSVLPVV